MDASLLMKLTTFFILNVHVFSCMTNKISLLLPWCELLLHWLTIVNRFLTISVVRVKFILTLPSTYHASFFFFFFLGGGHSHLRYYVEVISMVTLTDNNLPVLKVGRFQGIRYRQPFPFIQAFCKQEKSSSQSLISA